MVGDSLSIADRAARDGGAPSIPDPVFVARRLVKRFGAQVALDGLELSVGRGEVVCLLGANGAGKTTTINLFLGFTAPSEGTVTVDGIEPAREPSVTRRRVAYIPEQVSLFPLLTGIENLDYLVRLAGARPARADLLRWFAQAGLDAGVADRRVAHYSKGMRQKVGIAVALAKGARGLLLDEPLSGLDPQAANDFSTRLKALRDGGSAILMATHDLFRARDLAQRVVILKHGRAVQTLGTRGLGHAELEALDLAHMVA
jgi:ABC-2 type transport system ATP-binding protein